MKRFRLVLLLLATVALCAGTVIFLSNLVSATETSDIEDVSTTEQANVAESNDEGASREQNPSDITKEVAPDRSDEMAQPVYPTAWLVAECGEIPLYEPVQLISLPGFDIVPRNADNEAASSSGPGSDAVISYNGQTLHMDPSYLLVNLPDLLQASVYDAVYSYSATSRCAGTDIPGLTGERLDGYADGRQYDAFLDRAEFVVPASYHTALMLADAEKALMTDGYAFCFYDVYRPYRASVQLSRAFTDAYYADPAIQSGIGGWALNWYAADGVSGHNFGTDVDTGVCDARTGEPIAMPSHFDAFDESGHLSVSQLGWQNVHEGNYRQAVLDNPACMALHRAMTANGFRELASEWWHFGDAEGESQMTAIIGPQGLDFQANMPAAQDRPS